MSKKLEQSEFNLEKVIGIQKHAGKVRKYFLIVGAKLFSLGVCTRALLKAQLSYCKNVDLIPRTTDKNLVQIITY